jgi:hypothetical protein
MNRRTEHAVHAALRIARLTITGLLGLVVLFALCNLVLTVLFFARLDQLPRLGDDAARLALSGPPARGAEAQRRFEALYAGRIAPDPAPARIRAYFEQQLADGGPLILDQVLADYIIARWGTIDGRTIPAGVYVGARALGPDRRPWSWATRYPAHYALYPRHGYVLVVGAAAAGERPVEFSASRASDFLDQPPAPHRLAIKPEPFQPGAYDFPGPGQAIHELFRLSGDPQIVRSTVPELTALAAALPSTGARYELFGQNSNTVLGCMLRASDLHRENFERLRQDRLTSLRLMSIGRPLWSHPMDRDAGARCR